MITNGISNSFVNVFSILSGSRNLRTEAARKAHAPLPVNAVERIHGGEPEDALRLPGSQRTRAPVVDRVELSAEALAAARALGGAVAGQRADGGEASSISPADPHRPDSAPSGGTQTAAVAATGAQAGSTEDLADPAGVPNASGAGRPESSASTAKGSTGDAAAAQLTEEERRVVEKLARRDREVRAHENAHIGAGGATTSGAATFAYQTAPDGRRYAVGGEVGIQVRSSSSDPEERIRHAEQVRRAALAPAQPSGADLAVAAAATREIAEAQAEPRQEAAGGDSGADPVSEPTASAAASPPSAATGTTAPDRPESAATPTGGPPQEASPAVPRFEAASRRRGVPAAGTYLDVVA